MTLAGRHLVSINDFSNEEIRAVLDIADEMNSALDERRRLSLGQGKELYTIFYEPSTRTRSS
ncbi:MAG: aspartate carbamoyltransferase, partial [Chloroflexota bacterium]|nr:aspartate carbamoyltransferase [Chloroflexota bacterium]